MFALKNRWIYIALLALYSFLNIRFTGGDRLVGVNLPDWYLGVIILLMVAALWEGNLLIQKFLRVSLRKIHPLIINFLVSLVWVLIVSVVPLFFIPEGMVSFNENFRLTLAFVFRVNLFLHSINAIVYYINQLKDAQIETQKLKRQTVEAQFEALRNQVNPHFLFNSFNVLSNLVYKDPDTSARFIEQLAKVYRYLIYHQENKLVPLTEELEFIEAYLYLLEIRFSENLQVQINLPENIIGWQIAPVSLQLLIENAIKHNTLSQNRPLHLILSMDNGYISVSNNVQPKSEVQNSTGVGLQNIVKRYRFLTDKAVEIENNNGRFTVRLPLIETPGHESANR